MKREKIDWERVLKSWNAEFIPFEEQVSRMSVEIQLASFLTKARLLYERALNDFEKENNWAKYNALTTIFVNAYNELCFRVLNKMVSKDWFNDLYKNELLTLTTIETNFKIIYEKNIENYNPIRKCLEMIRKEKK